MAFIIDNQDEEEFISQISTLPDRIVGIVAPTIIHEQLKKVIMGRWQDSADRKLLKGIFRETGGILGSFGAQIQIGLAARVYGDDAYQDLNDIEKIRNSFAHKLVAKSFDFHSIGDRANRLRLPSKYPVSPEKIISINGDNPVEIIANTLKHSLLMREPTNPRERFIRTIEIASAFLWVEDYINRSPGIPARLLSPTPRF